MRPGGPGGSSLGGLLLTLALALGAVPLEAQAGSDGEDGEGRADVGAPTGSAPEGAVSPARDPRLVLHAGMWSLHLNDAGSGPSQNWLLGLSRNGYFGATLVNSFGARSFAAGREGRLRSWQPLGLDLSVGFRLGLVTGYDERFVPLARHAPVLPLAQIWSGVEVGRSAVQLALTARVASISLARSF